MEYYMPVLHDYVGVAEAADVLGVHWDDSQVPVKVVFEQRKPTIR
jgi:hypothetical protein